MESSLHRELKRIYAGPAGRIEVRCGRFRVDAVIENNGGEELIEIQHGPLWAIRDKIQRLTRRHRVRIVKPIIGRKRLLKRDRKGGRITDRRFSPRQGNFLELFDELVYFTRAFPHPNLTLEVLLVDVEELRHPRRRQRRWRQNRWTVEDQRLLAIRETVFVAVPQDLRQIVACKLPQPFHTAHLAAALGTERFAAQRLAYVLRKVGAAVTVGKQRGAWLYRWADDRAASKVA
jgi:hypothetical protein